MTVLRMAVWASLALCALGLLWRAVAWVRVRIGPDARALSFRERVAAVARGVLSGVAGRSVPGVLGALLLDVLLQWRLLRRHPVRWAGHVAIVAGFSALVVVHGIGLDLTAKLIEGYQSTLDPWLFVRNLAGALVVAGVAVVFSARAFARRGGRPSARRPADAVFVLLLSVVLATGFALESVKIVSPRAFYRMADEYVGTTDPGELFSLRVAWAEDFGVAFPDLARPPDPDVLAEGREMHGDACAECHSPPAAAFVSWPVSRMLVPYAGGLDEHAADGWLYWVHVAACLLGLATLPFTRLFHVVADPVGLAAAGAASAGGSTVAGRATRRALALDACVRCGLCDARCSVAPIAKALRNPWLLPSHKASAAGGGLDRRHGDRVAEGASLCTSCGRCTEECPVGIDLEDLWTARRGDLADGGRPDAARWVKARPAVEWAEALAARPDVSSSRPDVSSSRPGEDAVEGPLSADRRTFSPCVQCQACTNVCPVVAHSTDPAIGVDLTPQKVMNLLRLGMRDLAIPSRMVWDCATCYQCQEHCPEGIRVTDVMLELRAIAHRRLGTVRDRRRT
ncbi:MAG: 4Fe-4S dicluster domain-containing protein [Deltaproteobacteria bacterium]|nr:4Fe-4S dicluster domain-containing protein [Deltaproteobacteria bacterium]